MSRPKSLAFARTCTTRCLGRSLGIDAGPAVYFAFIPLILLVMRLRKDPVPGRSEWPALAVLGVLLIGLLLLAFRQMLPIDALSAWSERAVGAALIVVGVWGVHRATRLGVTKLHDHLHARASFAMGTLHGLAGSSHLFGILPAMAFASGVDGGFYLGGFGAGAAPELGVGVDAAGGAACGVDDIRRIAESGRTAIVFTFQNTSPVEHNIDLVREVADQVCVLQGGHIIASGTAQRVLGDETVIREYLGRVYNA